MICYIFTILVGALLSITCFAQETRLREPDYQHIGTRIVNKPFRHHKIQQLALPFREDFFQYATSLNPDYWEENEDVQVHFGVGITPPNRGVVVLDGAQKNGVGYADIPSQGDAEILQSLPIDLSTYTPADSLYLSFFVMHGGKGDKAETSDSLKLFFIDNTNNSQLVWFRTGGDTMSKFQHVMIPINQTAFFHNNFQFYFVNRGNLNGMFDIWLLDYFYLDANRTASDTLFTDLSFSDKRFSIFDSLMAIPLKQFQSKPWMTTNEIEVTNLNNNNEGRLLTWNIEESLYNSTLLPPLSLSQFFAFFPPTTAYPIPPFSDQSQLNTYANFRVHFDLNQNASDPMISNDTLYLQFPVDSVWAYDDGEAETGYGLNSAKLFVQAFYNHTQDTLKAVQIAFVPNLNILEGKGFELVILNALHRDSVIYSKFYNLYYGEVRDSFNYFLLDSLLPLPSVYYIGIKQPDNKPIGVGFDLNYNNNRNVFWDSSAVMVPSRLNGTLMIRPVMGSKPELAVSRTQSHASQKPFIIFPNPTTSFLNIFPYFENLRLELYNSMGDCILKSNQNPTLDLSNYPKGMYFLIIIHNEHTSWHKVIKE